MGSVLRLLFGRSLFNFVFFVHLQSQRYASVEHLFKEANANTVQVRIPIPLCPIPIPIHVSNGYPNAIAKVPLALPTQRHACPWMHGAAS